MAKIRLGNGIQIMRSEWNIREIKIMVEQSAFIVCWVPTENREMFDMMLEQGREYILSQETFDDKSLSQNYPHVDYNTTA
jgi:hypothetical protein